MRRIWPSIELLNGWFGGDSVLHFVSFVYSLWIFDIVISTRFVSEIQENRAIFDVLHNERAHYIAPVLFLVGSIIRFDWCLHIFVGLLPSKLIVFSRTPFWYSITEWTTCNRLHFFHCHIVRSAVQQKEWKQQKTLKSETKDMASNWELVFVCEIFLFYSLH